MLYPTKKLLEVGEIITGYTPSKNNKEFWGGNTLFVKPPHLGKGNIVNKTEETLSDLGRKKGKLIKKNSIMVCCIGSLGKIGIAGQDLCTNQQINSIYFNEKIVDFKYGYYYCTTLEREMNLMANQAIIAIINKTSFSKIQIPLPSLPTQKLIVQKLDLFFEKIDKSIKLTKKNLENIEELNKSVLEEVFKKSDFKEKSIDKISNVKSGKRLPKGNKVLDKKTEFPYIRVSDFDDNGTIDLSNLKYITEDVFNQISRYIITEDDLYISIAGTIGKTGIIPSELNGASLTENAVRLVYKNKNDIFNKYVYYFTTSLYFKEQAGLATRAVAMPKLAITRLKEIQIPLPPIQKQKEIVAQLDKVFEKNKALKESYEKKLKDLEEMKQSLLKEAFEGRLVK